MCVAGVGQGRMGVEGRGAKCFLRASSLCSPVTPNQNPASKLAEVLGQQESSISRVTPGEMA